MKFTWNYILYDFFGFGFMLPIPWTLPENIEIIGPVQFFTEIKPRWYFLFDSYNKVNSGLPADPSIVESTWRAERMTYYFRNKNLITDKTTIIP